MLRQWLDAVTLVAPFASSAGKKIKIERQINSINKQEYQTETPKNVSAFWCQDKLVIGYHTVIEEGRQQIKEPHRTQYPFDRRRKEQCLS